jgi:outer membrane protein assembly factor BamB/tRNA A-37 threonylcarbamoyl transferase component Bud32
MPAEHDESARRDQQVQAVLHAYLQAVDAGHAPDLQEILRGHPDLREELAAFFADQGKLDQLARSMRPIRPETRTILPGPAAEAPTLAPGPAPDAIGLSGPVRYFGDYELLAETARGGMGVVYKARQVTLNRTVALKMILAGQLASDADVQRFHAEAETAANLQHPNIVAIHEVGQHDGQHYFSMDFVEGQSLADLVRNTPLPPVRAARYVKVIAEAIHYAHGQGTLHRDLKPSNVLIDAFDQPRVTDFGLARRIEGDKGLTATGAVVGTPSYMPPEQASADRGKLGPASDVYSLGAVLYELVTGRPPFRAATPLDTLLQVLSPDPPAAPRLLNAAVDRDLETIILKCLAKEREQRYATAAELANDLQAFLEGRSIRARRPGVAERLGRWVRRNRRSAALAVLAATVSALLLVGGLVAANVYSQWRQGRIHFDTDGPVLMAQAFDQRGDPASPRFTIPTQEPFALPEGAYELRVSGQGGLVETYRFDVEHGEEHHFDLDLKAQQLWEPITVPRTYETVDLEGHGRSDVLLLSEKGVSRLHGGTAATLWTTGLEAKDHKALAGFHRDWRPSHTPSGRGVFDRRPVLLKPAPDLDGDGTRDLVWASRRQAALLVQSGKTGQLLWCFLVRPKNAAALDRREAQEQLHVSEGTVLGSPALLDLDGKPVLIATMALVGEGNAPPRRWVQALAAKTGEPLWAYDLDERWFSPVPGGEVPYPARWYGSEYGMGIGGGSHYSSEMLYANDFQWRTGGVPSPYAAEVVRVDGRPLVLIVAGTRLLALDPRTRQAAWPALDLGFWPARPPQFVDLDGDGNTDVLLHRQNYPDDHLELLALKLRDRGELWRRTVRARWRWNWYEPAFEWPLLADLDSDRKPVVIVPDGDISADSTTRWAGVTVLDGASGRLRWRRPLVQEYRQWKPLYQVNRFTVGPDLDGDGHREVFVVSSSMSNGPEPPVFFVDALSGKDGHSLWWYREPVPLASISMSQGLPLGPLRWWQSGPDGWPQLVVPRGAVDGNLRSERQPAAYLFSAGTGRLLHKVADLPDPEALDLNGDGIPELISFHPNDSQAHDAGGKLLALRGRSPEAWRRLGASGEPGQDLGHDGYPSFLSLSPSTSNRPRVAAISGRTGRRLWHFDSADFSQGSDRVLAPGDLDGDGVSDVLFAHTANVEGGAYDKYVTPLEALSGATGRRLWMTDLRMRIWQGDRMLELNDLRSGKPDVLLAGISGGSRKPFDDLTSNIFHMQIRLAVLSGRTGKVRWQQPLTEEAASFNLNDVRLHPLILDLDGDGVRDVVVPAVRTGMDPEALAFSGTDGRVLWRIPAVLRRDQTLERDRMFLASGDLDGDGKPEVVLLHTLAEPDTKGWFKHYCEVLILDGATGRVKGKWRNPVDQQYGFALTRLHRGDSDPIPLVVNLDGGAGRAVCVWAYHYQEGNFLVLLDARGQEIRRTPITFDLDRAGRLARRQKGSVSTFPLHDHVFQVWAHDLDGDGKDELLYFDENRLRAVRGDLKEVVWEWPLPDDDFQTPEIWPAQAGRPVTVVLATGQTVYGLDGATGKLLWRCVGSGRPTYVLRPSRSGELPRVVSALSKDVTACNQALAVTADGADAVAAQPFVEPHDEDPRVYRPLPWLALGGVKMPLWLFGLLVLGLSVSLLVIPAVLLRWAVRQRSWLLGLVPVLWLCLAATLWFAVPFVSFPGWSGVSLELELRRKGLVWMGLETTGGYLLVAVLGLPLVAFVGLLLAALRRRLWMRVGLLGMGALLLAVPVGLGWMHLAARDLGPWEQFSAKGWYGVGLAGTYPVGVLLVLGLILWQGYRLVRWLIHRRSVRPNPA